MKIFDEFKAFISRGNVVDLAVAVIMGNAFGKIITSVINDLIMPPIGYFIRDIDFKELRIKIGGTAYINYGNFIQNLLEFLIISFIIFLLIKSINLFWAKEQAKSAQPVAPTTSEKLLMEIRDLLKR